jgi:hypothetical protein
MKRQVRLVLAIAWAFAVAAGCAGTANTTPSPTQLTSATSNPTLEPAAGPTPTPTTGPTLIPYPGPSIPPGTLIIEIGADLGLKFDRTTLTAPPNTPFVIAFDNRANLPPLTGNVHNVAIKLGSDLIFNPLPAIVAPAKANYFISEGLPAGTYQFLCIVHPVMHGTLTIT